MTTGKLLAGKVALITGAGRGIGQAVAAALAKKGAGLALVARKRDQLQETASICKEHGAPFADVYTVDLTDPKSINNLAADLLEKHKTIDILVNNAGVVKGNQSLLVANPDDWDMMLMLNLAAPMRLTRLLTPGMAEKGGGTIINLCSVAGIDAVAGQAAYAATKHGLRGWSLSCYEALRSKNIKVVSINPGFVNTPMVDNPDMIRERMLQPEDIAEAVMLVFRTSDACVPQEITLRLSLSPFGDDDF